jgi:diguanylate cyclase (GGDEF)-like protein/PAS domain S-box-containing protein
MAPPNRLIPEAAPASADENAPDGAGGNIDLSMLIRTLGETDRRLEELTGAEIDLVTDREGRSYLLRRAQERWRRAAVDQQAIIIDALPASLALLDAEGVILSVNESWRRFAGANALAEPNHGVGRNYLEICDGARGAESADAARAAAGLRAVLAGAIETFSMEYACHGPAEDGWYQLMVTPVRDHFPMAALVMHHDITARKRAEEDLYRFSAAMEASSDGIRFIDRAQMRIIHVNEAACRMHQMPREQVLALKPWEVCNVTRAELESVYDRLIAAEGSEDAQVSLLSLGHAPPRWIEVRRRALCIGGRWTIFATDRDVTAQKEAESRILHLNRLYAVLSGINALIVRARDRDELFRETCRILVEEGSLALAWIGVLDKSVGKLQPAASAGIDSEILAAIARRLDSGPGATSDMSISMQVAIGRKPFVSNDSQHDKHIYLRELHVDHGINSVAVFPLLIAGQSAGVMVLCARETGFFQAEQLKLLRDLAGDVAFAMAHFEKQERLDYLAYYDALTGLANRTLYRDRVAQHVRSAAAAGGMLALILIDLERFKNINDSLGRAAGDSMMRQMAEWLTRDAGDVTLVAHIEADRFAVVMPEVTNEEEVARHLERTLERLMNHSFTWGDAGYRIAAKAGVALYPGDGDDADILLKHAEVALKKAKSGGDRYLFYALKMTETVVGRLNLENQLRHALELDQFVLHYQPKMDVASGKLVGAEALIRWKDPSGGMVPPGHFIPILEETGLIHEVGRWALGTAMAQHLHWRETGLGAVRIAVNLSALQLRNRDFVANIERVLSVDAQAAAGLELEITESVIMDDVKLSIANLNAIRAMGVRVAIDDFGTGFSSLSYLSKLPVDSVKIDRSFVADMVSGPEGLSLVSIIINLAHSLKLQVVAEGVETEEQSRLLQLLSCDEMQGYLFSKPLPAELFERKYLADRAHAAPPQP